VAVWSTPPIARQRWRGHGDGVVRDADLHQLPRRNCAQIDAIKQADG
jgi:hypothetical protein